MSKKSEEYFNDDFWKPRVQEARLTKQYYQCIFRMSDEYYIRVQNKTKELLTSINLVNEDVTILDMGCGIGSIIDILPKHNPLKYLGIDLSTSVIGLARELHPDYVFEVADARSIRYPDKQFDLTIARYFFRPIVEKIGKEVADICLEEVKRVSKTLLIIDGTLDTKEFTHEIIK